MMEDRLKEVKLKIKSREGHASLPERKAAQARAGAYSRIEVLLRNNA